MAEDSGAQHDSSQAKQHTQHRALPAGDSLAQPLSPINEPIYPGSLLSDPRLRRSANLPVRISLMRQAQQTYGNRALRQMIQARQASGAMDGPRRQGAGGPGVSSGALQRYPSGPAQHGSLFIQRSTPESEATAAAEQDTQIAAQKLVKAREDIESVRAGEAPSTMEVDDPFAGLPQVRPGAVATRRTVPFTVDRGDGPETFRVPINDLEDVIRTCREKGWRWEAASLPRGYNLQLQRDVSIQRVATPTGFGGGTMNENAAKTVLGVAAPNLANGTLTFNGVTGHNTSTGASGTDLNRQPTGAGVGATRPLNWTDFVAMIGAINPFKQGHQMHHNLGGDGNHDNLAPFTGSLNALHYTRVESHVLNQTDGAGRDNYANYSVTPNYLGNPGIVAWAQGQFGLMTPANQRAAMVTAGIITAAAAAAIPAATPLSPAHLLAANAWITAYVNGAFPTDIDCSATFIDPAGGGATYNAAPPQNVNITNDM